MEKILKFLLVIVITLGAVWAGYSFLSIRADFLFWQKPPANVEPIITVETLDEGGKVEAGQDASHELVELLDTINSIPAPERAPAPQQRPLEDVRLRVLDSLRAEGAEIVDSRAFDDKAVCDQAVLTVVAEYRKRGVREQDSAKTSPFPNSTGLVWLISNGGKLNYIGCVAHESQPWGIYVHFIPGASGGAARP